MQLASLPRAVTFAPSASKVANSQSPHLGLKPFACLIITVESAARPGSPSSFSLTITEPTGKPPPLVIAPAPAALTYTSIATLSVRVTPTGETHLVGAKQRAEAAGLTAKGLGLTRCHA